MRTRSGIVIAFLLILSASLQAQPAAEADYEKELEIGIEHFYQTDWKKASAIFERLRGQAPDDPRAYFFDSMIPFWAYFFGGESPGEARKFLERSGQAIAVSRNRLRQNPHDTTMVLLLSGLHGYRSLVAASEKNYREAIESGMAGFTYTRQLLSLDAEDPKALIGKGIFYYMLGSVPGELRWATNMMGMRGDKEEGFAILMKAAESDSYISNDARMILSYLYNREGRYGQALTYIEDLCHRYGENVIFRYYYAELLEKKNRRQDAIEAYRKVVELDNSYLENLKRKSRIRLHKL